LGSFVFVCFPAYNGFRTDYICLTSVFRSCFSPPPPIIFQSITRSICLNSSWIDTQIHRSKYTHWSQIRTHVFLVYFVLLKINSSISLLADCYCCGGGGWGGGLKFDPHRYIATIITCKCSQSDHNPQATLLLLYRLT
jgi:hypothetical protein